MKMHITAAISLSLLLIQTASAENTEYVYKPSPQLVTNNDSSKSPNCNQAKTLDELLGEKVVFVALTKGLQTYGYSSYHWTNDDSWASVPYDALVGKVGTITEIEPRPTGTLNFRKVIIKLEASDESVITKALDDSISDITLLSDIEEGRKRWVGKTLWYKKKNIRPSTDAEPQEWLVVTKKYQPVTVSGVMVGAERGAVDFVLKFRNGQEGLVSVELSVSNTSPSSLKIFGKNCSFDANFFIDDPRLAHNWPEEVWSVIENDQVVVGMNMDQVIMAWGEPDSINTTSTRMSDLSQWIYSNNRYVYLNGSGKVTAVQQ